MKSSLHRMNSDIKRGIERWENEGGRIPFAGSRDNGNLNNESEWGFQVLFQTEAICGFKRAAGLTIMRADSRSSLSLKNSSSE